MSANGWRSFAIWPHDVLYFRDGKPSTIGADHYLRSIFPPYPSTIYGAIRTRLLVDAGIRLQGLGAERWGELPPDLRAEIGDWGQYGSLELRGPWLTSEGAALFPAPMDLGLLLVRGSRPATPPVIERVLRYRPIEPEDGTRWSHPLAELRPFQRDGEDWTEWLDREREPAAPSEWYLRPRGLERWAEGSVPEPVDFVHRSDLWVDEPRTGVGLQPDSRTSREGRLFTFGFVRLQRGVGLGFELRGSGLEPGGFLSLGGERRTVQVGAGVRMPDFPKSPPKGSRWACVALATPSLSKGGAFPPGFSADHLRGSLCGHSLRLVAAAVPGSGQLGGWDISRGRPKPMRSAIPARSVFFFAAEGGGDPREIAPLIHGTNVTDDLEEAYARQGFGLALAGVMD